MTKSTIRDLINKLEKIDKEANRGAHGEPTVGITLEFEDEELERRYFYGKIIDVQESFRMGCGCSDGANILIKTEE
jgi:hypothetical protein